MTGSRLPDELIQAYRDTDFVVSLEHGSTVTCQVGKPRPQGLPGSSITVITAWNPGLSRPSEAQNQAANERLAITLKERGIEYIQAWGQNHDGSHIEPSFAAFDLSKKEAIALGREFGQAAVFWIGETLGELLWCE